MSKLEPTLEKVPPVQMLPLERAPVEKLRVPKEWPGGAVIPLKLISSDPTETMPLLVIVTVPYLLVRSIPSALAAITVAKDIVRSSVSRLIFFPPLLFDRSKDGRAVTLERIITEG